nr:NUDIX domain-containing protein [Candidatus Paceibacterota bacterium]
MEKFQKIVVTGFVYNEGKTLLLKRSSKESFLPEYWELPGGKVNFGEIPEDGLVREYKEETGLEISVGKPFRTFSYVSSD